MITVLRLLTLCLLAFNGFSAQTVLAETQSYNPVTDDIINIDSLFMLNNFSGKQGITEITANAKAMDTRNLGNKLKDKKIFLITGEQDKVVPPLVQKQIAEQYQTVQGLEFESHFITGDHVFSVSRIKLQTMVIQWMNGNCR